MQLQSTIATLKLFSKRFSFFMYFRNTMGMPHLKCQSGIHPPKPEFKRKSYNYNASIYFNQKCLQNTLTSNSAKTISFLHFWYTD